MVAGGLGAVRPDLYGTVRLKAWNPGGNCCFGVKLAVVGSSTVTAFFYVKTGVLKI